VDRDVVFGPEGLPWLPARRLKGLLRGAYRELIETEVELGLPPAAELFGETGREEAGLLRLGNARFCDADELEPWLAWLSTRYSGAILPEDVIARYSEIRRQTAIDPRSGAALQDTLRATRVLRSGLVFHAPVAAIPAPVKDALALAAANLQLMGRRRPKAGRILALSCWSAWSRRRGASEKEVPRQHPPPCRLLPPNLRARNPSSVSGYDSTAQRCSPA
jgi:CRISPR-associated protein Csx10